MAIKRLVKRPPVLAKDVLHTGKFRLKEDAAPHYLAKGDDGIRRVVYPGQVVASDDNLALMFREKFDEVHENTSPTKEKKLGVLRGGGPQIQRMNTASPPTPLNKDPKTINKDEFTDRRKTLPEKTDDEEADEEVNAEKFADPDEDDDTEEAEEGFTDPEADTEADADEEEDEPAPPVVVKATKPKKVVKKKKS